MRLKKFACDYVNLLSYVNSTVPATMNITNGQERSDDVHLRTANLADAAGMDDLNRRSLPENYPLMEWQSILTFGPTFSHVAYANDKLIGYCLGIPQWHNRNGIVASIAVDERFRGKGIGKALLLNTLQSFRQNGLSTATLNVRISNVSAQRLYKKLQFKKQKLLHGYYKNGEDALLMETRL